MFIDLNQVDSDPFKGNKFDICICGGGVAGVTLALDLSTRFNVALLEAGGFQYSDQSQSVYQGKIIGRDYFPLTTTRLRFLGGSSNHWGGWCRPLDSHDFDAKPYMNYSGWPIRREDIDPYMDKTLSILNISEENRRGQIASHQKFVDKVEKLQDFKGADFWWSRPATRIGEKYKEQIENAENITCFLNANLTDIKLVENLNSVQQIEVHNYNGSVYNLTAENFILAAGGIENPRILLNCDRQIKAGIGNQNGNVGRFFCEHPHHKVADFILEDSSKAMIKDIWTEDFKDKFFQFFAPSEQFMKREEVMNFGLNFIPGRHIGDSTFKQKMRSVLCMSDWTQDAWESLRGTAIDCVENNVDGSISIMSEQAPNPSSRVTLGSETDKFGMRRTVLDWRMAEIDKRTIQRAAVYFGESFARLGLGRIRVPDWIMEKEAEFPGLSVDGVGGHHHMCTTRMSDSPAEGVVDRNLKVFGVDNLYVAGSSVFSTGGYANPTFTIVQMTLRLADHLKRLS